MATLEATHLAAPLARSQVNLISGLLGQQQRTEAKVAEIGAAFDRVKEAEQRYAGLFGESALKQRWLARHVHDWLGDDCQGYICTKCGAYRLPI